jgi:colicin import membrane protein
MNTQARLDLAPPAEAGSRSAVALSLLAHLLLGAALAWGVNWTKTDPEVGFSAELWSPIVKAAAPAAVTPPPPPPPPPPTPPAAPVKRVPPPTPEARPPQPQADIALEREKKRKLEEDRKKAAALKEKTEKEKVEKDKAEKDKAEKDKAEKDKLAKDKADKALKDEEARKLKDKEKERELAKAKEEARKEEARKEAAAEEAQAAAQAKLRQEQMQRIQGMAGATGSPDAKGTALRASAPSASYAGKIIELIQQNTVFNDASAGRPSVVVMVKTSSSGLIVSRRVVTSSGNKAWEEAVLRAVDKMANVPRDTDGRIPEVLLQDGLEIKVTFGL